MRIPTRFHRESPEVLEEYANILVYTPTTTWWANLPLKEVVDHLGANGLHYSTVPARRLGSALIGGVGGSIAVSAISLQILPALVSLLLFAVIAVAGAVFGWRFGAQVERDAQRNGRVWAVRSSYTNPEDKRKKGSRTVAPMGYEALKVIIDRATLEDVLGEEILDGYLPATEDHRNGATVGDGTGKS